MDRDLGREKGLREGKGGGEAQVQWVSPSSKECQCQQDSRSKAEDDPGEVHIVLCTEVLVYKSGSGMRYPYPRDVDVVKLYFEFRVNNKRPYTSSSHQFAVHVYFNRACTFNLC